METDQEQTKIAESAENVPLQDIETIIRKVVAEKTVRDLVVGQATRVVEERKEQERTTRNKELFLEFYPKVFHIGATCIKIGIGDRTYREWMREDPQFNTSFYQAKMKRLEYVEDKLFELIQEKDGQSIRYFMDKHHPEYKTKNESTLNVNLNAGNKSFTQLLWEHAKNKHNEENGIIDVEKEEPKQLENGTSN